VNRSEQQNAELTDAQRAAIIELGSSGAGGEFDARVMSELFSMGIVEIRSKDRRLVLTDVGRRAYYKFCNDRDGG
jgi:hypothetical protein